MYQGTLQIDVVASAVADESLSDPHTVVTEFWVESEPTLTVYVRNETSGTEDDANAVVSALVSGGITKNFYNMGDVTASAGDILTFAIVQTGGSHEGPTGLITGLSGVSVTPTIPPFTSYVDGTTSWNGNAAPLCKDGGDKSINSIAWTAVE